MDLNKKSLLSETFKWLFIGLLVCFGVSYFSSCSEQIVYTVYGGLGGWSYLIFCILEIVLCIVLSARIRKMSKTTAILFYLLYAALTGLTLSGIFLIYLESSIAFIFLVTAIIFGIFALIGAKTNINLTKIGTYLLISLLAIILLEIVNIFLLSSTLDMTLCIITIIVFSLYIVYDINMILKTNLLDDTPGAPIYFAFQLFLDFINLLLKLLSLFGKRRD